MITTITTLSQSTEPTTKPSMSTEAGATAQPVVKPKEQPAGMDATHCSANSLNKPATHPEVEPATVKPVAAESVEPLVESVKAASIADTAGDTTKTATATAWRNIVEHPLQSFLTALIIAMLGYSFATFNINIGRLDNRIDRLEDKVDNKFEKLDNKIDALEDKIDDKIDGINLRLTALIAHLGATTQVDAATG